MCYPQNKRIRSRQHNDIVCSIYFCNKFHPHGVIFRLKYLQTHTWCGRKVMRLAMLCTNRQCCCLPLHVAVRLTPAVDSVQVWTCYSCYTIVESTWSEVVNTKDTAVVLTALSFFFKQRMSFKLKLKFSCISHHLVMVFCSKLPVINFTPVQIFRYFWVRWSIALG